MWNSETENYYDFCANEEFDGNGVYRSAPSTTTMQQPNNDTTASTNATPSMAAITNSTVVSEVHQ